MKPILQWGGRLALHRMVARLAMYRARARLALDIALFVAIILVTISTFQAHCADGMIACAAESYEIKTDTLSLLCPGKHIFSPFRAQLELSGSPSDGRELIDIEPPNGKGFSHQAKLLSANGALSVRLPYRSADGRKQWLGWREFKTLRRICLRSQVN